MDALIAVNKSINPDGLEIHPVLLELLCAKRFSGSDTESPYGHLQFFEDICGSFMFDDCDLDKVKIQMFGQTLSPDIYIWYKSFCAKAPRTWIDITAKFLSKYYS